MNAKIAHVEIIGADGQHLQDFYAALFGWRINSDNPMHYGLVNTEDSGLSTGVSGSQPGQPGRVTVYIGVDDLEAALRQAESLGAQTLMAPTDVPGGPRLALFADPAGNVVGLMHTPG
jgi:uncharacterized protein